MTIQLFEHNKTAYKAAVTMLAERGKIAVIHPTGTGKSFIGFKLCEDNPDKIICWLSPSRYIYQTQLENLAETSDGYQPENIKFFTYAKLMLLSDEELSEIQPDFIILDEFHRCGAELWGMGVQKLLKLYPDTKILGLSATAIRYLDNQRNMTDELFDGNIASEMTLGEAIVRGILNPPKYILSVFSYQKDLEKYEKRVKSTKSKAARDAAAKYLDALKHTLEKADGLDVIFKKHITDKSGKYLIFCSNVESMNAAIALADEWFGAIDKEPNIYKVYTADSEKSKAFADFKADTSNHLKLLYCIDMLNEGVHTEDISGVILLRPTVSPIIYKQQIGRALSASKSKNPVIFDIVANIENLYSIGTIEDEMHESIETFRAYGSDIPVINERFEVIDEVKDCIELFEKLNDTLTASWDIMYQLAEKYYLENGNLNVGNYYRTEDGYSLGHWIYVQRRVKSGKQSGILTDEQIEKLDKIGMIWEFHRDITWEKYYAAAKKYYETHHTLDVPVKYADENGIPLGSWLAMLRRNEKAGFNSVYLTSERKKMLEDIGMVWDMLDYFWEQNFNSAYQYYLEHRHLDVPTSYIDANGVKLGAWLARMRQIRDSSDKSQISLSDEQIRRLDSIGMIWTSRISHLWNRGFKSAERYVKAYGDLNVPALYIDEENDFKLGAWIKNQRIRYQKNTLETERILRLNQLGMIWENPDPWLIRYELLKKYYTENGTIDIPQTAVIDGVWLGKWIRQQYKYMQHGKLTDEQNQLLQELPLNEISISSGEKNWKKAYDEAKKYYDQHGTLDGIKKNFVTENGIALGIWLIQQRRARRLEKLSDEQIKLLDEIEFVWVIESAFDKGMRYARAYFAEHGNLDVQGKFITSDGYPLGAFIYKYRRLYADGKLSEDIIRQFEEMCMVWNVPAVWEMNYIIAKQYYDEHGCLPTMQTAQTVYEEKIAEWSANQLRELKSGNEKFKDKHKQQLNEIGIYAEANMQSRSQNGFQKGYSEAQQFFEESGHLQVSGTYRGADGFLLNEWIKRIRKVKDTLSDEQIRMLESIGIQWETETPWNKRFKAAKEYYDKHGVLPVKSHAKSQKEKEIATWIKSQKMVYSRGEISAEHLEKLREIGLNLDERESNFERGYQNAKAYFDEHGNLNVPAGYQCENGFWLSDWLKKIIMKKDKLLPEQVEMLNEIGIDWSELSKTEKQWESRFSGAERFYNENGYLPLEPKQCRNDAEKSIWQWLRRQLLKRDKGELTKEQIDRLSAIGMDWLNSVERAWQNSYQKAKAYFEENTNLDIPLDYRCHDGYTLGMWLYSQRKNWEKLNPDRQKLLLEIGFKPDS